MKQLLTFVSLSLLLFGCSKGPGQQELEKSVQQKLDTNFQDGLFKIKTFSRRGSYQYNTDDHPEPQLLVYYKAQIEFLKDYKLSDWNNLNASSLISTLGATPLGVTGLKQEGNKKSDVLVVYGTNNYIQTDGKWLEHSSHIKTEQTESETATKKSVFVSELEEDERLEQQDLPANKRYLLELENIAKDFRKQKEQQNLDYLNAELKEIVRKAKFQAGKTRGWMTIATGSAGGEYHSLGNAIAQTFGKRKMAKTYNTSGSQENCELVEKQQVLFAFTQNDIAAMAYNGSELFEGKKASSDLRAVCSLYPEAVHIMAGKKITDISQLVGKKINIGAPGSGARANALQIIKAYNLKLEQFEIFEYGFKDAVNALQKKEIDALFTTRAYPTKLIQNTSANFLSVTSAVQDLLTKNHSLIAINIPKNTYSYARKEVNTVGVTAMIVTHKDTPKEKVQQFLDTLFKNVSTMTQQSSQANYISPENAQTGISIPLHDAAKSYFTEKN
ncbi:TAXI family TRAP transporter solute-binding subunit [Candidatus Uabimicrobium sp. HlEnr_7]|uniref:TAXI family TRAP transporter solute-binding subunit n=1 Tax=Candidatus Uabimicrobium helgolandensis TaxID=3095367 RepID=UPI0035583E00